MPIASPSVLICLITFSHTLAMRPVTLRWRHNGGDGVSNHQPRDCLLNRLFRHRSKKTSKLHVTGLCAGNSPGTGEFPSQRTSYAENVSIWWRHHGDPRTYFGHQYHLEGFILIIIIVATLEWYWLLFISDTHIQITRNGYHKAMGITITITFEVNSMD